MKAKLHQLVRVVVGLSAGTVLGAIPGALYAGLVSVVHLSVYGRGDRLPAFAMGCILAGMLLGLLGRGVWTFSSRVVPPQVGRWRHELESSTRLFASRTPRRR
jgi:hypothetical protein